MEIKEFTFRIILLGFPGICCYFLLKKLIGKVGNDTTESVLSIFVLSLLCYFISDLALLTAKVFPCLPWKPTGEPFNLTASLFNGNGTLLSAQAVIATTLIGAPVVAGLVSLAVLHKVWNRLCQELRVTRRFGDDDLFNLFLESEQGTRWYLVRDHKEKLVYYATIGYCSDEGMDRELILQQVDVFPNEGAGKVEPLYSCPALYLCRKRDDITIETVADLDNVSKNTPATISTYEQPEHVI